MLPKDISKLSFSFLIALSMPLVKIISNQMLVLST